MRRVLASLLAALMLAPATASADTYFCSVGEADFCQPGEELVEGEEVPLTPEQELENREAEREAAEPGAVVEVEGADGGLERLTPEVEAAARSGDSVVVSATTIGVAHKAARTHPHYRRHHRRHRHRHHHR